MPEQDQAWNLFVTNYGEGEYHSLSKEDFLDLLDEEWARDFNGIFIGRDVDCIGRLGVFFYHSSAYVGYESFVSNDWWSSFDPSVCYEPNQREMVRLSPDDTQDWSFPRCSIIPKDQAWVIVEEYVNTKLLVNVRKEGGSDAPAED
jgi:hypothetical protein